VSALDAVLARLERVKRSGNGWVARCPAHEDRHPSLSIGIGEDGRVLLHCHAGAACPVEAIVAALGLKMRDLFERTESA
jgi:putative DNA primase/helicase